MSVGLQYRSVTMCSCSIIVLISRKGTLVSEISLVNFIEGCDRFKWLMKLVRVSSPCGHNRKMSSMYLSHTSGCNG